MDPSAVIEVLRQFVPTEITITTQSRLAEDLLIDSMNLIDLILSLEETFQLQIPTSDVRIENFQTVEKIIIYIERTLETSKA